MATTSKISVALGRDELRFARKAAKQAGSSLSAFLTYAVREQLEAASRRIAGLELLASYRPEQIPTPEERRRLLEYWRAEPAAPIRRRRKRAR